MERILLLGYFGAGNFGDDALLTDWLARHESWLRDKDYLVDITVTGEQPPIGGFFESDSLVDLTGAKVSRDELLNVDTAQYRALVIPGGSLLQDESSLKSLLYYLWVIRRFILAKVPVYMLNQGIGPLHSWIARFLTPRYLQNTQMLSFRDRDSYEWAKNEQLLANHSSLYLVCDPMLNPAFESVETANLGFDLPTNYVLFIPRPTGDLPYPADETTEPEAMVILVKAVVESTGLTPILLPLHPHQDLGFCEEIKAGYPASVILDPQDVSEHYNSAVLSIIAGAKMVISHRLHGLVTAVAHDVPVLGVAYDPKVISFCEEVGYPFCFPATTHNDSAAEDVRRLWNVRDDALALAATNRDAMVSRLRTAQEHFYDLW